MKKLGAGLLVLAAIVGAIWKLTQFDRLADRAADDQYLDDDEWLIIAAHPEDPRVLKAARVELHRAATVSQHNTPQLDRLLRTAGPVLERHAGDDQATFDDVAQFLRTEGDLRVTKFTKRSPEELVTATARFPMDLLFVSDGRVRTLEQLRPKASGDLVYVLLLDSNSGADSLAARHLAAGVPPDGQPFAPLSEGVQRIPPATDPRYPKAFERRLRALGDLPTTDDFASLQRMAALAPPPPLGFELDGILKGHAQVPGAIELTRALGSKVSESGVVGQAFDDLRGYEVKHSNAEQAIDAHVERLVALGPGAVKPLSAGLSDPHWAVRRAASRALERIDRHAWGLEIAAAIRTQHTSFSDAKLTVELARRTPIEPVALFACLTVADADMIRAVRFAVTQDVAPAIWIPALFDNLAAGESFPAQALAAYRWMLDDAGAGGPLIAAELQKRLDAAGGNPAAVGWVAKKVAIEALGDRGTRAERAVVAKFASDPLVIENVTTTRAKDGFQVLDTKTERVTIGELATQALARIDAR